MAEVTFPAVTIATSSAIRTLVAALAGPDPWGIHRVARQHEALPVYGDLGGTLFVQQSGEILALEDRGPHPRLRQIRDGL